MEKDCNSCKLDDTNSPPISQKRSFWQCNNIHMPKNHMDNLYNSKNPIIKFVQNDRLNSVVRMIPNENNLKILDAGCGEGHLIEKLYSKDHKNFYYGFDITEVALESAKKRCPYANIQKMDITNITMENGFFDTVICSDVLEHVMMYKKAIRELKRVLKKGGELIITFPKERVWTIARIILRRNPIRVPDHINTFTLRKMKLLVKLKVLSKINLPRRLPLFFLSLGCLIKFKKCENNENN